MKKEISPFSSLVMKLKVQFQVPAPSASYKGRSLPLHLANYDPLWKQYIGHNLNQCCILGNNPSPHLEASYKCTSCKTYGGIRR
nr:hypothetical protein Iba_chr08eCG2710 [Ipomoea batatas]